MNKGKIFLGLIVLFFLVINSCQKDNSGSQNDYTGSWHCYESTKLSGINNYEVSIDNDPSNSSQVLINNFYNLGSDQNAQAIATETGLTLLNQTVLGDKISGSGVYINKNKLTWSYNVIVGGETDIVYATYTR